jgi:hypothetical protein
VRLGDSLDLSPAEYGTLVPLSCIPQCSRYTDSATLALHVEEHIRQPTFEVSSFILFTSRTTCGTLQKILIMPAILKPNSKRLNPSDKIHIAYTTRFHTSSQTNRSAVLKTLTHSTSSCWCKMWSFTKPCNKSPFQGCTIPVARL